MADVSPGESGPPDRSGLSDNRAVSQVVGYVLTLSIATVLVGGLLMSAGGYVEDQRRTTAESELRVIGQQVAADVAAADRLARTTGAEDVRVGRALPRDVVGAQYRIEVVDDGDGPTSPYLELSTTRPEVTVVVGIANKTDVEVGATASGGRVVVTYDAAVGDQVVVGNGD